MGIPGYDCVIYKDGKEVFRHMNGYSDREKKIPMKGNEKYNIYSCSKPITCAAALQLYEKGLFKFEDKLCDYMPEFTHMKVKTKDGIKDAKNPITIFHLFTMTAGFTYNTASEYIKQAQKETGGKCPTVETMKYIAREPLLFEPGTSWNYSFCHDVLAALVEVISGMKFEDYVEENIFRPLGMKDSTFRPTKKQLNEICPQYKGNINGGEVFLQPYIPDPNPFRLGDEFASGGAGCISTLEDYIKFCEGMINYKVLKKETIDLMKTDHITKEQHDASWLAPGIGYGLGVRCASKDNDRDDAPTDFGWGGAAGAYQVMDTVHNITMFYVQHVLNPPNNNTRAAVKRFAYEDLLG